jgi:hypothetical protein
MEGTASRSRMPSPSLGSDPTMRPCALATALLLAAVPAAAQPADPPPFPGIAWGVTEDSVLRAWGEPVLRRPEEETIRLDFLDAGDERGLRRYFLVHPRLGTMIAGYGSEYGSAEECRALVRAALRDVEAAFPAMRWEADRPNPDAECSSTPERRLTDGQDPESGTRVSIRVQQGAVVADALSRAGWDLLAERQ